MSSIDAKDRLSKGWKAKSKEFSNPSKVESRNLDVQKMTKDSLAERSKARNSSSGGEIRVGSNPTAVKLVLRELLRPLRKKFLRFTCLQQGSFSVLRRNSNYRTYFLSKALPGEAGGRKSNRWGHPGRPMENRFDNCCSDI